MKKFRGMYVLLPRACFSLKISRFWYVLLPLVGMSLNRSQRGNCVVLIPRVVYAHNPRSSLSDKKNRPSEGIFLNRSQRGNFSTEDNDTIRLKAPLPMSVRSRPRPAASTESPSRHSGYFKGSWDVKYLPALQIACRNYPGTATLLLRGPSGQGFASHQLDIGAQYSFRRV